MGFSVARIALNRFIIRTGMQAGDIIPNFYTFVSILHMRFMLMYIYFASNYYACVFSRQIFTE